MRTLSPGHRTWQWSAAFFALLFLVVPTFARVHKSESWANSQFASAESLRQTLNQTPAEQRTRRQYQRVIDAYRRVYFGAPASAKADPSAAAVAELMVVMGRQFNDDGVLRTAIKQYEFLRREYPGSKSRFEALFAIGEIYRNDLNQPARSKEVFEEFLRRYPRHRLAEQARQALAQPVQQATAKTNDSPKLEVPAQASIAADPSQPSDANSQQDQDSDSDVTEPKPARVTAVRFWSTPDYTRVAIDLDQEAKFQSQRLESPGRVFFDLFDTKLASSLAGKTFDVDDGFLKKIRVGQYQPGKTRVVLEVDSISDYDAFLLSNPRRLIIDIRARQMTKVAVKDARPEQTAVPAATKPRVLAAKADVPSSVPIRGDASDIAPDTVRVVKPTSTQPNSTTTKKVVEADDDDDAASPAASQTLPSGPAQTPPSVAITSSKSRGTSRQGQKATALSPGVREAQPTANGDRSLIRALGLKIGRIVIDPGHGGHDTGTIGPNGLEEKELVLDVSRRLGKLLQTRLGAEVVFTRTDDTFIPLETRTVVANREQADLFVSVHANSSRDPDARGVETYYLNFTSSADALEVAARENAVSDKSIHELQDLVKKIALKEKIEESHEFASDVQQALHSGLAKKNPGLRDRGVKKAPFIVLIGANMPSILAEISFVSNPGDERRLKTPDYRQRIAEALFRGISKYVSGLSGVRVASKVDKTEEQQKP